MYAGRQGSVRWNPISSAFGHWNPSPGQWAPSFNTYQRARRREGEVDQGRNDHPKTDWVRGEQIHKSGQRINRQCHSHVKAFDGPGWSWLL